MLLCCTSYRQYIFTFRVGISLLDMNIIRQLDNRQIGARSSRQTGWKTHTMESTNKRQRTTEGFASTAAQDGAEQVGQGLQVTIPRAVPHAYNNNYTVRLTYADTYNYAIAHGINSFQYQTFKVNSIFDPDDSGVGHQPYFRDMWASQYDYYAVLACDYKATFYNCAGQDPVTYTAAGTSGQNIGAVNIVCLPTTTVSDITTAMGRYIYPGAEMKNATSMMLVPGEKTTISGTLTPGDFIVDAKDSDTDTTWTANGTNPSVPRYWGFSISSLVSSALVGVNEQPYSNIAIQVILNYTVQFTQVNPSLRQVPS